MSYPYLIHELERLIDILKTDLVRHANAPGADTKLYIDILIALVESRMHILDNMHDAVDYLLPEPDEARNEESNN